MAFLDSSLENISIPAKVIELKNGWCCKNSKLSSFKIDPMNSNYSIYEGKSTEEPNNFCVLISICSDINDFIIPSFIKIIEKYTFYWMKQVYRINFEPNSSLQTIESFSFAFSANEAISIPSHVIKICENAFLLCDKLERIEFRWKKT